ncbi:hypothetical protein QTO34_019865, partial [Cnephaeus nilssonii]
MWKANSKAWVTRQFYIVGIHEVCAPSVKEYLREKQWPLRALPVLDNAPAHLPAVEEYSFITVRQSLEGSVFQTMQSAWKTLWPESGAERGFEGFADKPVLAVEDTLSLGQVNDDDVEELMEDHNTELSTEELLGLQREQPQTVAEELSRGGGGEGGYSYFTNQGNAWVLA